MAFILSGLRVRRFLFSGTACAALAFAFHCGALAREREISAYLWRQAYDAGVEKSLAAAGAHLDSVNFLCAKITFDGPDKTAKLRDFPVDFEILQKSRLPKTASVRIEGLSGGPELYCSRAGDVASLAAAAYRGVKENLPDIVGLQIDFDCPESKIADYALWMEAFRNSLPEGAELSFTALPSQMDAPGFKKLAGLADYFVLQIHHYATVSYTHLRAHET